MSEMRTATIPTAEEEVAAQEQVAEAALVAGNVWKPGVADFVPVLRTAGLLSTPAFFNAFENLDPSAVTAVKATDMGPVVEALTEKLGSAADEEQYAVLRAGKYVARARACEKGGGPCFL